MWVFCFFVLYCFWHYSNNIIHISEAVQQEKENSKCIKSFLGRANSFKIFFVLIFNLTLYMRYALQSYLKQLTMRGRGKLNISEGKKCPFLPANAQSFT